MGLLPRPKRWWADTRYLSLRRRRKPLTRQPSLWSFTASTGPVGREKARSARYLDPKIFSLGVRRRTESHGTKSFCLASLYSCTLTLLNFSIKGETHALP